MRWRYCRVTSSWCCCMINSSADQGIDSSACWNSNAVEYSSATQGPGVRVAGAPGQDGLAAGAQAHEICTWGRGERR
jgi:hypothetical protein